MFIGVMSGTSMDAVDVTCVDLAGDRPTLVAAANTAWPQALLQRVRAYANHAPLDATALAVASSRLASRREPGRPWKYNTGRPVSEPYSA